MATALVDEAAGTMTLFVLANRVGRRIPRAAETPYAKKVSEYEKH